MFSLRILIPLGLCVGLLAFMNAQQPGRPVQPAAKPVAKADSGPPGKNRHLVLKPARVFDGVSMHDEWIVVVRGDKIVAAGSANEIEIPADARIIDLPKMTVLPGLIDAHTHVLLHPYNEASWDDQVLKEAQALRICRATNHLRALLASGFTTIRDLGTQGGGYSDVGLKQAIEQHIIPGPRMLVTTRAIVATRTYAPRGFAPSYRFRRVRKKWMAILFDESCGIKSGAVQTRSRFMPTTMLDPRSRWRN